MGRFVKRKIALGIGRFGIWVHKVNSLWFTYPGVSVGKWRVIFVLCSFVYALQQIFLLVDDFVGSFSGGTMNNPGIQSLNLSIELGHIKAAIPFWIYSVGQKFWWSKGVPRYSHPAMPLSLCTRGSRNLCVRGFSSVVYTCPTCSAQLLPSPTAEAPLLWPSWLVPALSIRNLVVL